MRLIVLCVATWMMVLVSALPAAAHFGMVIPSDSMVMPDDARRIDLTLSFSHPMEQVGMPLAKPESFIMVHDGRQTDLTGQLKPAMVMGHSAWQMTYPVRRPGAHIFVMTPTPYWEPAEDTFIVHITKTVVAAFGDDEGWDTELGLKAEIVPLTKPFGLYAGNLFQGIVKRNGKPVPFAEVEVEYNNRDKAVIAPTAYMITQTLKADANGIFSYSAPKSGWWGFAALMPADTTVKHNGQDKPVELGALIWVQFVNWKESH